MSEIEDKAPPTESSEKRGEERKKSRSPSRRDRDRDRDHRDRRCLAHTLQTRRLPWTLLAGYLEAVMDVARMLG